MLVIRLKRIGRKNDPSFRVVLADSRKSAKSGKLNEVVGSYNPRVKNNPPLLGDRILYWMSKGAKPSPTVHNLLVRQGVLKAAKINVLPSLKKTAPVSSGAASASVPTEAATEASAVETEPVAESPAENLAEAPSLPEQKA